VRFVERAVHGKFGSHHKVFHYELGFLWNAAKGWIFRLFAPVDLEKSLRLRVRLVGPLFEGGSPRKVAHAGGFQEGLAVQLPNVHGNTDLPVEGFFHPLDRERGVSVGLKNLSRNIAAQSQGKGRLLGLVYGLALAVLRRRSACGHGCRSLAKHVLLVPQADSIQVLSLSSALDCLLKSALEIDLATLR